MTENHNKIGVLLVNLGTPDEPSPAAVKRYLAHFLHDKRVIDYTRWLWCPLLHFIILPFRSKRSAKAYQKVWTSQGSPLLTFSQKIQQKLQQQLPDTPVELAMTYGSPSVDSAIGVLTRQGVEKLLVLPLFPQYSSTTTAAVFDAVGKALKPVKTIPELRFVNSYCKQPSYVEALAESVRSYWAENDNNKRKILMSFHGIPKRYVEEGDVYQQECEATAKLVAEQLELSEQDYMVCYQSRVGREQWLQPYTDETLQQLAKQGETAIDVMCPAFAVDCLETLEEIAMENRELFEEAGGKEYGYIPALNDNDAHIASLKQLIEKHTNNWE
jgi:ferrochelatase